MHFVITYDALRSWSRSIASLTLAILAVASPSAAQSPTPPSAVRDTLRLGPLLEAIERGNPRIEAARATARAARARIPGASRAPDPQLQLGLMNREFPNLRPMDLLGMTQIQVMQMVPVAGKLRLAGLAETARADATDTRVLDASADLRARGTMLFYDLYATDGTLRVARDTRRLLQDIGELAGKMYQVGEGRQVDVLRANVEQARMQEDLIRMETMRTTMAARLSALIAAPIDAPVGVAVLPRFPSALPSLDSLQQLAERFRPMLRAGAQDVNAAEASARLAEVEIWPDLQVGVQLATQGGPTGPQRMGSLMVGAAIPIAAGTRQRQVREETGAMRAMAAAELAIMRAETRGAVAEAHASLVRARRLADLYRSSVLPQAAATVASSLSAYRVGGVNFMTLLDAQMTLNRYRQELFTLEADEGKAWAQLEMLTGRPLVDAHSAQPVRPAGEPLQ